MMECTGCQHLTSSERKEHLGSSHKYVFMVTYTCNHPARSESKVVYRAMIDEDKYEERIGQAPMPLDCPER